MFCPSTERAETIFPHCRCASQRHRRRRRENRVFPSVSRSQHHLHACRLKFLGISRVTVCVSNLKYPKVGVSQYQDDARPQATELLSSQASVKLAEELADVLDDFMVRSHQLSIDTRTILIEYLSFQWVMRKRLKQVAVRQCVSTSVLIDLMLKMSFGGHFSNICEPNCTVS